MEDRKIPSLWALMSEKTEEAYQNLWEKSDEKCQFFFVEKFWTKSYYIRFRDGFHRRREKIDATSRSFGLLCSLYSSSFPKKLVNYVEKTWIQKTGVFMWNVYGRPPNHRTTNACESWHAFWNRKIGRNHPSFWVVVEELKKQEKITKNVYSKISRGEPPPPQKKSGIWSMPKSSDLKTIMRRILSVWTFIGAI